MGSIKTCIGRSNQNVGNPMLINSMKWDLHKSSKGLENLPPGSLRFEERIGKVPIQE